MPQPETSLACKAALSGNCSAYIFCDATMICLASSAPICSSDTVTPLLGDSGWSLKGSEILDTAFSSAGSSSIAISPSSPPSLHMHDTSAHIAQSAKRAEGVMMSQVFHVKHTTTPEPQFLAGLARDTAEPTVSAGRDIHL